MQEKVYLTPYWLMFASMLGIGDTLYLSYEKFIGVIPSCAILNGCEKVLTSVYSTFLGVPLAYFGLVFYVYMLCAAFLLALDPLSRGLRWGILAYALLGVCFSIGFELVQGFLIHAFCMYCAISAATTLALLALAVVHVRGTQRK